MATTGNKWSRERYNDLWAEGLDFYSYETHYPDLFELFWNAGWTGGSRAVPDSFERRLLGIYDYTIYSHSLIKCFYGLSISSEWKLGGMPRVFTFDLGSAFDHLRSYHTEWELVFDVFGNEFCQPVGESEGHVLFVRGDGASLLLEQSLRSYALAPNPFALLNWWMFLTPSDGVTLVQR